MYLFTLGSSNFTPRMRVWKFQPLSQGLFFLATSLSRWSHRERFSLYILRLIIHFCEAIRSLIVWCLVCCGVSNSELVCGSLYLALCSQTGSLKKKKAQFVVFSNVCGINTPTTANLNYQIGVAECGAGKRWASLSLESQHLSAHFSGEILLNHYQVSTP